MSKSQPLTASGEIDRPEPIARAAASVPSRSVSPATMRTEIRIGTSGWHYRSWHGPFYPQRLKIKDFLSYYIQRFDTAEINNSFYRLPTEHAVKTWHDSSPKGFLFAWKASRFITHMKRLNGIEESIDLVFGRMNALGDKFGPVLFQLPPTFKADDETRERVARCLSLVPDGRRCAFEFRHPSWYEEPALRILRDHNAALCISDHADAPAPWEATADFVYLRAHGTNGRYAGSYSAGTLQDWAQRIGEWRKGGRSVYAYFDNDIKSAAPGDAQTLLRLMNEDQSLKAISSR
ncbi:DUF72 domain-containing protein [Microvirga lotononidis]|uniref:DUF72 domain-containing protein n=1 Tax=Microvirga lotononidis TaxID=864069 RepID=I4YTD1_9HYPH|nr:DUF72 domain-containing protein [Microvirga lotononidis]EIM27223.1 hypothetical protein MicloDRAFT_00037800 [Microvirga lotononidis]WQO28601.1 DUF72 domain-containing protein [Microvirga lotononidis]